ncbi:MULTISPECIES: hypothetical protein [Xanthomonas]|uniref:hypothetical protein n=1 Tax=Xanthomonas TaxID=338 RepID=UPI001264778B|nr:MULTISPECIES: hypothetical protein [Xanthomonas]MDY4294507.1 hypothetical protein [Xanthomonas sp. LF02-5]MDY4356995.1 hypothetical protein [Xanthomonas sp. LF04-12]
MKHAHYRAIAFVMLSHIAVAADARDTLSALASATPLQATYADETPRGLSQVVLGRQRIVFGNANVELVTRYQGTLKTHPRADEDFFSNTMDGADLYSVTNRNDEGFRKLGSSHIRSVALLRETDAQGAASLVLCLSDYEDLNHYFYKDRTFTTCTRFSLGKGALALPHEPGASVR